MRTKWLAKTLMWMLKPKREPDFLIGPEGDPYMKRWYVIPRNRFFNIYLHNMLHDDDDRAAHDHPWWSLSLCLKGYIQEKQLVNPWDKIDTKAPSQWAWAWDPEYRLNAIQQGDWKYRGVKYSHMLQLPRGEAWTLFITGPKIERWGFHCRYGWRDFEKFTDKGSGNSSVGAGCGELE